ncbi:hypothetical protein UFOVP1290_318 [uncultured Caudovirales phage]|uniref:Uncharacterized protein n=1 Tax=uncultured Caudovirales phage TaxID=2100421 RepID=A0A6J5RT69_9CAUD|nr:hypothetical protein UFOVP1290_318 [uncultured Caudovirales phage]
MYSINKKVHDKYGYIVEIYKDISGEFKNPEIAYNKAKSIRRIWKEELNLKVRFLIDGKIMQPSIAESWSVLEYKSLPKCAYCICILDDNVFTHKLSDDLFCSSSCADKDYDREIDKINDQEDIEYL